MLRPFIANLVVSSYADVAFNIMSPKSRVTAFMKFHTRNPIPDSTVDNGYLLFSFSSLAFSPDVVPSVQPFPNC